LTSWNGQKLILKRHPFSYYPELSYIYWWNVRYMDWYL
jgi:hypothetical protein